MRINGAPVTGPGQDRAVVFQSFGLFPWKTVLENIMLPLTVRKDVSDEEAEDSARFNLNKVGLVGFEDAHPPSAVWRNAATGRPGSGADSRPGYLADGRTVRFDRRTDSLGHAGGTPQDLVGHSQDRDVRDP